MILTISGQNGQIDSIILREPKTADESIAILTQVSNIPNGFITSSVVNIDQEYLVSPEFIVKHDSKLEEPVPCFTREVFMNAFRDDRVLDTLSVEDRKEIFLQVLLGSSDITKELLDELLSDYEISNLKITEINE